MPGPWIFGMGAAIETLVASIATGDGRLDVLVNAAALNLEGSAAGLTDEAWEEVLDVNLKAAFRLSRAAAKPMLLQRGGAMVHLSSVAAGAGGAGGRSITRHPRPVWRPWCGCWPWNWGAKGCG